MAAEKRSAMTQLNDITLCCICLKTFTDPRMLPCIHTFCFHCLKDLAINSNKKPGDKIECPICRKQFTIPRSGIQDVQKNFFMTSLMEVRNTLSQWEMAPTCDICKANNDAAETKIPEAIMRCLVCQANLCKGCCKKHKSSKISKNHEILRKGREVRQEEAVKSLRVMNCHIHRGEVLDYYCADCKKVVCISCLVDSHKTHDCKDVNRVEERFRQSIKSKADTISTLAGELLAKRNKMESEKDFLQKIAKRKSEIVQSGKKLKATRKEHTKSLLSSLDEIKNRHLKEIQMEEEALDRRFTLLESFSRYCDELGSKGSASEVCRCKDELLRRVHELEEDHEAYIMRSRVSIDVTFEAADFDNFSKKTNENIIESVKEKVELLEDFAVMIGVDDSSSDYVSYKMILNGQSDTVSMIENVPITVERLAGAAVYNNTMFITGVGETLEEIWKYNFASGWKRCGSLVQGRENHCAEFIGEILYICGGSRQDIVMDSIESYNALTKRSKTVGQLIFGSIFASCVVFKGSVYVFGGIGNDKEPLSCVQVYNPVKNNCTILSTPLPRPCHSFRSVLWENYAILLGHDTCLILDLNEKIWRERQHLKTNTTSFGIVSANGRIFIIGGTFVKDVDQDASQIELIDDAKYIRASSIVNNEASNWKTYSQLPKPIRVLAVANLTLTNVINEA